MFRGCWEASDSKAGFEAALKDQGFVLTRGDRRGFVAVDAQGKIWSLSRWCGIKPKEMRARLGSEMDLQSVQDVSANPHDLAKQPVDPRNTAFEARRAKLVTRQRSERSALLKEQEAQRVLEVKKRQAHLPKGLRGLLFRAMGQYQTALNQIKEDGRAAQHRDRAAQHVLVTKHLTERQALTRDIQRQGLSSAFLDKAQSNPKQALVSRDDGLLYSKRQLLKSPELVVEHISQTKASFKRVDILRALARRIDDPVALQKAADQAMKSPELVRLAADGSIPVFTTQDYRKAEHALDAAAQTSSTLGGFSISSSHIKQAIKSQNTQMQHAFGGELSREQRAALDHVLGDKQLTSVVGLAGAGKSTLLATARDAWARQGVTVHGAALAGKAAEELETASGISSRTLASLELSWKNGYAPISKGDVLVVDEAGMVGTRQLSRVANKMNEIGAKLVLVGDPDQLQPIEAGTPFRRVVNAQGAARLTEIHRQKAEWQKQASRDLAEGNLTKAVGQYHEQNAVMQSEDHETAVEALVESYVMDVAANGTSISRLAFAHKRKDVHALNQSIRAALRTGDDAKPETMFSTETGNRAFAADDRIVFTRNDKDIGVKNGMLGTVVKAQNGEISVALDGETDRLVRFDPRAFRTFDHGYVVTIHKSQGATVDQSYVLASHSMDRHLAYVAMTRHRDDMHLFINGKDRPTWATDHNRQVRARSEQTRGGPSMG